MQEITFKTDFRLNNQVKMILTMYLILAIDHQMPDQPNTKMIPINYQINKAKKIVKLRGKKSYQGRIRFGALMRESARPI